jgi:hypothetical protein
LQGINLGGVKGFCEAKGLEIFYENITNNGTLSADKSFIFRNITTKKKPSI